MVRSSDIHTFEAFRYRESLWNTKSDNYKNRNIKKKDYEAIMQILKDDNFLDADMQSVKGTVATFWGSQIN
jgi:hypothetical protein